PILVKKGSIIPMMPVMQYIGELKDHPLYLHVYPAENSQPVDFELYEDDGESQDYLDNKFCKTNFRSKTTEKAYELSVAARNSNGFEPSAKRKLVWMLHVAKKPVRVLVNKKPVTTGLQWDAAKGIFSITVPDNGKAQSIEVIRK
ncbi:MAG: DUF5110 domain-containing protein, partial [Pseudobacter sp.]|uniref:DUF5110 domain-containing protein n=1 Tax=Pseudobacter sp. TaxID=2045420 RepID=UPI003F8161E5